MSELSILKVPRAFDGVAPLSLDMTSIHMAATRIGEVAIVNSHKAPELLALFNVAYLDIGRYVCLVEFEYESAISRLGQIKSVILLDRMIDILREKGLSTPKNPMGSEDIRQAVFDSDPEYKRISELIYNLKCYRSMLVEQKKGFEMAFTSVKKIMGDSSMHGKANPYLITEGIQSGFDSTPHIAHNPTTDYFGDSK
jgi:hypothetical protein